MKGFLMNRHVTAIILAAGSGSRMNLGITKQKINVGCETVLHRTLRIFNDCPDVNSIVLVIRKDEYAEKTYVSGNVSDYGQPCFCR